jgi:hypothetical protein
MMLSLTKYMAHFDPDARRGSAGAAVAETASPMNAGAAEHVDGETAQACEVNLARGLLPEGLTRIERLSFLDAAEKRLVSQVQGRTYANIFGLVERFISAKVRDVSHEASDQIALEALTRLGEELKHQQMFRRIEHMAAAGMAEGYVFLPEAEAAASMVVGKSAWAVLALICHIELVVLAQYRESIEQDRTLSAPCKDALLYHWHEESQHAVLAEAEWMRENARLTVQQRDRAVDELIELIAEVDRILQSQSRSDADYFLRIRWRTCGRDEAERVRTGMLDAYRWQYLVAGVQDRFGEVLNGCITPAQHERIGKALGAILS